MIAPKISYMKIWIFILFFMFYGNAFSQKTPLEQNLKNLSEHPAEDIYRVNILLQLGATYFGVDTKKLSETAKEAFELSKKLNFKKGMAESLKLQGAANISLGNYKTAESYFSESLKIFQSINYAPGIIICYSNLGSTKLYQNLYPEALRFYQISIRYAEKLKDFKNSAFAYGNMGIIYSELKNYNLALSHFNQALQNHIKSKNENGIASIYSNIGTVYLNQNNYSAAHQYYQLAIEKNQEIGNQLGIAREYGNIASLYMKENNYEKAFKNIESALKINQELKNNKGIAINFQGLGEYYLHENQLEKSKNYLSKALKIASEIGTKDIEKATVKNLSELYDRKKNPDSAYYYYKKYVDINEEINNENIKKQISRLEIQYEFDAKEEKYKNQQILDKELLKQNELLLNFKNLKLSESNKARDLVALNYLKTQAELKNEQLNSGFRKKQMEIYKKEILLKKNEIKINLLKLSAKEKQKWYLISGSALLAIIGGLLFYQSRNRKKTSEKLKVLNADLQEANKVKARFFGILNHDLRNPVSNLIHFLHLQKEHPELLDENTREKMESKIISGAENLLYSMESILLWGKGQMENFKPQPKKIMVSSLFEDTERHFSDIQNTNIIFENKDNIEVVTDEDYLKTIIRNLTGNAIKATANIEKPSIIWKAWKENQYYYLSISDNGTGANQERFRALYDDTQVTGIKSGLGLHLIRDLAKVIHCTIDVHTESSEGTTFILKL